MLVAVFATVVCMVLAVWHWINRIVGPRWAPAAPPFSSKPKEVPARADAVVIGAGPSGLATAVLLGRRGYRVLVLEQHDRSGGGLHSFEEKGFEFDTGLHYVGEMETGKELRMIVDSLTGHEVEWRPLNDKGFYDEVRFLTDGSEAPTFKVMAGRSTWLDSLRTLFVEEETAIDAYTKDLDACRKVGLLYAIWRSFPAGGWLSESLYNVMAKVRVSFSFSDATERLDALTTNPRLKALLSYVSLGCCGVPPSDIQYSLVTGLHCHFAGGGNYPVEGGKAVAEAMVRQIERQGGKVLLRTSVNRIMTKDGTITGVRLKKHNAVVSAGVVVSTVGLHTTVEKLLRMPEQTEQTIEDPLSEEARDELTEKLGELERSQGHLFCFVGFDESGEDLKLPRSNLWEFPSLDLEAGRDAFMEDVDAPFGYVGISFPSEKDRSYADRHPGKSTCVMIVGDVPWEWFQEWEDATIHKRGEEYKAFKQRLQDRMLEVLYRNYPQLKGKVAYVDSGSPLDTKFYLGKSHGESYGIKANVAKAKADVTWNRSGDVPGFPKHLYHAGQDLTCDGFAPAVLSALMACAAIEGPLHWVASVVPMFGGVCQTIRVLGKF